MAKYLDYDGLQYYTSKIKGTYNPQIENLRNNILLNMKNGVKNLLPIEAGTYQAGTATFTINADGTIEVTSPDTTPHAVILGTVYLETGTYVLSDRKFNPRSGGAYYDGDIRIQGFNFNSDNSFVVTTAGDYEIRLYVYAITNSSIQPMLCPKSFYDADSSYQPYAMSNVELTHNVATNTEIDDIWYNT